MSYSKSDIPDFLGSVGAQISDAEQRIDTEITEPTVFQPTFLRYVITGGGILNPKSRITFGLEDPNKESFLPLGVGIGALIQRVSFKIGGKTVCEVDDWAHYHYYKTLFTDQQVTKEREQYLSGRAISNAVVYDNGTNNSKSIGLDLGREFTTNASTTLTDMNLQGFQDLRQTPVFSLTLDDLVPALRGVSLGLFMLTEQVVLEITLHNTIGKRACLRVGELASKDIEFKLDQNECRMISDHTFLDGDGMNAYAKANSNLQFTFLEPRLTKTTLANEAAWTNQVRNVGGAGKRVPKMFVMLTSDKMGKNASLAKTTGYNQMTLLNDYRAIAPYSSTESAGTYAKLTSNIKKNDEFIFPIDRSNSALHYHGVQQTEGAVPHITRSMYARQGHSLADNKFESYVISKSDELDGQFFVQAYRMPDGARVDSRGLEVNYQYSALNADEAPFTQRVYIEIEKRVSIINGVTDTQFE
tara:strand:+ start:1833 stop:3245 length:1413 start_codon:yes stop_codon:yes gene_type:complete